MKKFIVPVSWTVTTYVQVEAEDRADAAHEASGVDLGLIPDPEYVGDSFEVHYSDIQEVPTKDSGPGDFSAWDDMPGGF